MCRLSYRSCCRNAELDFLYDGSFGGVLCNRSYTLVEGDFGGIHLAAADNLAVGGFQIEERLAVLCNLYLEPFGNLGVLADGLDTVEAGFFLDITLACEDDLAVGGLEVELEFSVLPDSDDKFTHSIKIIG